MQFSFPAIPGPAVDVTAELKTKTSCVISWSPPKSGGNVGGYKVEVGDKVVTVPADVSWRQLVFS